MMAGEVVALGDVGPRDDAAYTGEGATTMSYLRDKAREFQVLLNSLDAAYTSMVDSINSGLLPQEYADDLLELAANYEAHKSTLKVTAEAINAGAAVVNAAGGRMPQLSLPSTLGNLGLPIALPLATVAALGAIAALTAWGTTFLVGYNDRAKYQLSLDAAMTPEARAQVVRDEQNSAAAIKAADTTVFGALSGSIKWIALAVLGYFAYKSFGGSKLLK